MRKITFITFALILIFSPVLTAYANPAEQTHNSQHTALSANQSTSEVRRYSLADITEDHYMYDILNRAIQQQFGVGGGVEGLAEHANQWIANEPARRREERSLMRQQQRRFELIISVVAIIVCLGFLGIKKLNQAYDAAHEDGNDYEDHI